jgi:hypothetical protein
MAWNRSKIRLVHKKDVYVSPTTVEKRLTLFFRSNISIQLKEIAQHVAHEPGFSSEY